LSVDEDKVPTPFICQGYLFRSEWERGQLEYLLTYGFIQAFLSFNCMGYYSIDIEINTQTTLNDASSLPVQQKKRPSGDAYKLPKALEINRPPTNRSGGI
jgi:hypothetical protein